MKDIKKEFDILYSSKSEDEIIQALTNIIKGYDVSSYDSELFSNRYFKDLMGEIKPDIEQKLINIKDGLLNDIEKINIEIDNLYDTKHFNELKKMRRKCVFLVSEIDKRLEDLKII